MLLTLCSCLFRRVLNRLNDVLVAGAAAEIPFQAMSNLIARWIGISIDDLARRDNHSRRAVSALQTVMFPKTFLDRMQIPVCCQSLDRCHIAAISLNGQHRA